MKTEQISKTFSDETAAYNVCDYKATTIGEFVDEVLKESQSDWGYIKVGEFKSEYRYGKLLSELPKHILSQSILNVRGYGGWSRMDYIITNENQTIKK